MKLTTNDIKRIAIIGSGTLGLRVGLQSAISGFSTTIYDVHESALEKAQRAQARILKNLVNKQLISSAEAEDVPSRITWTTDPDEAAREADFVNESVTEDAALKKKVWSDFGPRCPDHACSPRTRLTCCPRCSPPNRGSPPILCVSLSRCVHSERR